MLKLQDWSRGQTPSGAEAVFAQNPQAKCLLDNDSRGFFSTQSRSRVLSYSSSEARERERERDGEWVEEDCGNETGFGLRPEASRRTCTG